MMSTNYGTEFDDSDSLGRQVLPVADLPDNFNEEPLDGMQYLFTVRRDARALPNTTRVPNPYQLPEAVSPRPSNSSANLDLLPSQVWLEVFEVRFRNLRENMKQPTIHVGSPPEIGALIPPTMDRFLWWAFLQGEPQEIWYPEKRSKRQQKRLTRQSKQEWDRSDREPPFKKARYEHNLTINDSTHPDGHQTTVAPSSMTVVCDNRASEETEVPEQVVVYNEEGEETEWTTTALEVGASKQLASNGMHSKTPREVSPTFLSLLDTKQPLQLIRSFTFWINHQPPAVYYPNTTSATERYFPVTVLHARWIFGLLSTVETHLTGDEIHILRELTRAILGLLKVRLSRLVKGNLSPISSGKESLAAWWVDVAIVATVWGQKDLWLDAEDMVRRLQS